MTSARRIHYTHEDYLGALASSTIKLEYCAGVIYAMAGGTLAHAELSANAIVALRGALPRSCRVATSDLKVRIELDDLATFPDVSVVCEEAVASPIDANAIVNPTILVEVTSRSPEDYDRGEKLEHYQHIPSLRVVLVVSHVARRITAITRSGGGWSAREIGAGEVVDLTVHGASLAVDAVYDGVVLDAS